MIEMALLLGLGGSLHCAGMCSPLALSVTVFCKHVFLNRLLYNVGRILVYGFMGILVALIGSFLDFSAYQNIFSIGLGALLIFMGLGSVSSFRIPYLTKGVAKLIALLKSKFSYLLKNKNYRSIFFMGMLNGLLPCGLTYLTLIYTLTLDSAQHGFWFMILFGLGTFPVMIGLPYVLHFITRYFSISTQKLTTIMMISVGLLLISRTMLTHEHASHPLEVSSSGDPVICR